MKHLSMRLLARSPWTLSVVASFTLRQEAEAAVPEPYRPQLGDPYGKRLDSRAFKSVPGVDGLSTWTAVSEDPTGLSLRRENAWA
jgi:hypothetical protein